MPVKRSIRTLIVDDEPIARNVIREELEQFEQIQIVAEAESGAEALELIESAQPSLVLLDLQMPGMSGFDLIKRVGRGRKLPVFVIATAYDEYAIKAFESGAIDYLLKPVRHERIAEAIEKAERILLQPDGPARHLAGLLEVAGRQEVNPTRRIVAKSGSEYLLLATDEVLAFEAEGDLVWIITARRRLLATETLRAIQEKLMGANFKRIHRKALVNVDHIRKMSPMTSQRWLVTLSNNQELIVSKRQAHSVRNLLSW